MTCPSDGGTLWWVIELAPFAEFVLADTPASPSSQVKVPRPCFERHLFATSTTFWPPIVAPDPPDDGAGLTTTGDGAGAGAGAGLGTAAGAGLGAGTGAGVLGFSASLGC